MPQIISKSLSYKTLFIFLFRECQFHIGSCLILLSMVFWHSRHLPINKLNTDSRPTDSQTAEEFHPTATNPHTSFLFHSIVLCHKIQL